MANLTQICEACRADIDAAFSAAPRPVEVIAGDLYVTNCCFVRDEIRFLNQGRLIFRPEGGAAGTAEGRYCREYFVVCRKLVVIGGRKPVTVTPCGPDDPGGQYAGNNVITWEHRLNAAASGPSYGASAADGVSQNRHAWSDEGQGDSGAAGGNGAPGAKGHPGAGGRSAPSFTLIALEVEVQPFSHLTIDFDGQAGGKGGKGQRGGKGGTGMGGRIGESDTTWPGTGCDRQPGHGGAGGDGGDGGPGGDGGAGGNAGSISVISTPQSLTTGAFTSGDISYVNDGATGGEGGVSGLGGKGGAGGLPGFKTSECDQAHQGATGADGVPDTFPLPGSDPGQGATGAHGASGGAPRFEPLQTGTCADRIPIGLEFDTPALIPGMFCRGFSSPATVNASLTGQHLSQVTGVDVSLSNVTASIKATSTDTRLDLRLDISGNSGLGSGNLVFHRVFGSPQNLTGVLEIKRFEVTGMSPATGARGNSVAVEITGECFDPGAALQQVSVSGVGVTAVNVLVLDEQHVQCVFEIGNLAILSTRSVTVKTGLMQHTLLNAFTIIG